MSALPYAASLKLVDTAQEYDCNQIGKSGGEGSSGSGVFELTLPEPRMRAIAVTSQPFVLQTWRIACSSRAYHHFRQHPASLQLLGPALASHPFFPDSRA